MQPLFHIALSLQKNLFIHLISRICIYKAVIDPYTLTAIRNNLAICWIDTLIFGNADYLNTFQMKQRVEFHSRWREE
jgi:hypothetical protein